jgi:membrane protein
MRTTLQRCRRWCHDDLWNAPLRSLPQPRATLVATLRILWHAGVRFSANAGPVRAAALSLTTLLALVPTLAIAIGLADVFGYREPLEETLVRETSQWPEGLRSAIATVRELVANTSFRALGALGTALVVVAALRLFQDAEAAFNTIHETPRRPWWRRVTTFAAVVLVLPPLAVVAMVAKSVLQNPWFLGELWPWLQSGYRAGYGVVPHALCWLVFTLLYRWLPSARVPFPAAAVAGVVTGSAWLLLFDVYLRFQVGVALNNAIYGTMAALPLLIVYLQLAWTVLLFGAELSRAVRFRNRLRPDGRLARDEFEVPSATQTPA